MTTSKITINQGTSIIQLTDCWEFYRIFFGNNSVWYNSLLKYTDSSKRIEKLKALK